MRIFTLALLALTLTACASPSDPTRMVAQVNQTTRIEASSNLYGEVSVGDVSGGRETNPLWTSQVSTEDFAEALRQSFAAHAMLSTDTGVFRLDAQLVELKQPLVGFDMTVNSKVQYTLTNVQTNEVVYDRTVEENFTARMGDAFVGVERLRLANEGSIRTNIETMISEIIATVDG